MLLKFDTRTSKMIKLDTHRSEEMIVTRAPEVHVTRRLVRW